MNFPGYPSSPEPSLRRPSPVLPGEEIAGKYRVDRVLGAGAMGVVVLAWHIELEQEVAIKFLHPELASKTDSAERFRREARSAVRIPSDHVARVLDVGTLPDSNIPFIVMEYLRGRDLARLLTERGPLPVPLAARFLLEACDAVGDAHARGIVHRDLKPANLFVVDRPGGGQMIKVLDFGISKTLSDGPRGLSITEPATLMGSPGYMSPEQLESSRNVDARTDIWSLGVILYEMVTGSLPFDGDSVPQLVRAVIAGQRAPLVGHARELEPVVARCLQQDRGARFPNIVELCDALAPFVREVAGSARVVEGPVVPGPAASTASAGSPAVAGSVGSPGLRGSEPARSLKATREQDGAWGRTHGIRRSPLWRTLGLSAVLGAVGAAAFWRGQNAVQSFARQPEVSSSARVEDLDRATPALQPASPPAPRTEPPAGAEGSATAAPGPTSSPPTPHVSPLTPPSAAPAAPPPSAPPASPAVATAKPPPAPEELAALDFGAALGTASGALPSTAKKVTVAPPATVAPKPEAPKPAAPKAEAATAAAPNAAAPSTAAPSAAVPEKGPVAPALDRNPYEILEFGGRK